MLLVLSFGVVEIRSTVTLARPKSSSLRTTIPEAVVSMIQLEAGDELRWDIRPVKDAFVVTITRLSAGKQKAI